MCHRMLVARALLCLLFLLVHLLLVRTTFALHLLLLLFRCACMLVTHVHVSIRVRTRLVHRVPGGEGSKVGFQSCRRFAPCLRGGDWGKISAGRRCTGGRLQVHFPGSNQAQVPGRSGEVRSHLPSTRRFLTPGSPGRGLGIRQSMGWTKVCHTARSVFGC